MNKLKAYLRRLQRLLVFCVSLLLPLAVTADETEIFYQAEASLVTTNVMFLLDASGSMGAKLPGSNGRSRMAVMQEAFRRVLNDAPDNLNIGLMGYANSDFLDSYQWDAIKGVSFPAAPIDADAAEILGTTAATDNLPDASPGTPVRSFLADVVDGWQSSGYTPIVDALYEASRYFRGEEVVWGKYPPEYKWAAHPTTYTGSTSCENPRREKCRPEWGECNGSQTSCSSKSVSTCCNWIKSSRGGFCANRDYSCSTEITDCQHTVCAASAGKATYKSPMEYACQPNFLVLMSDGKPVYPYFTRQSADGTGHYPKSAYPDYVHDRRNRRAPLLVPAVGSAEIPDPIPSMIQGSCADKPMGYASGTCGAELTRFLADEDQNATLAGKQAVETYTVAFGLGGDQRGTNYLASLATAENGAYTADNADQLVEAFKNVFGDIEKKSYSFSSPSFSVSEDSLFSNGNDVYIPVFDSKRTPLWSGNLRKFSLSDDNRITGAGDSAALAANGEFTATAQDLWSVDAHGADVQSGGAANKLPLPANRMLWTDAGGSTRANISSETPADLITPALLGGGVQTRTKHQLHYHPDSNARSERDKQADDGNGYANHGWYRDCSGQKINVPKGTLVNIEAVTTCGVQQIDEAKRKTLLDFARGYGLTASGEIDTNPAAARKHMGDMMNTKPLVVNYENQSLVLVATNEGYLHAIDASSGVEQWAFMPSVLLKNQIVFFEDAEEERHVYGLDGPLTLWNHDADKDGVISEKGLGGDKRLLFFGMRRGGKMYYALDITDPATPRVVWKIAPAALSADDNSAEITGFAELGETWSKPTLSRMRVADGTSSGVLKHVLVFGGGYDARFDEQDAGARPVGDALGADVYIVDALSGRLIWSLKGGQISNADQLTDSVAGDIRVLDMDNNGELDRLYFSDLGGNIWRVDMLAAINASAGAYKNKAQLTHFADLGDLGQEQGGEHRKFFYEPDTALRLNKGKPVLTVAIGSGYRTHPLDLGDEDRFYVLVDDQYVFEPPPADFKTLKEKDLINAVSLRASGQSILNTPHKSGWYLPLSHRGEKVLAPSLTFMDKVLFTTFAQAAVDGSPSIPGPCEPLVTTGRAYVLDLLTSRPVANLDRNVPNPNQRAARLGNDYDDFVVSGTGEIPDSPQLIFSKLSAKDGGSCTEGDCHQSVSVRIGKLQVPVLDLDNTSDGVGYSESLDLTKLLPHLYWRDNSVTE